MLFLKIHRFDRYDKGEGAGSPVFFASHSFLKPEYDQKWVVVHRVMVFNDLTVRF